MYIPTPFHAPVAILGGETPSRIRAWSLIRNETPIVQYDKTMIEKSKAIAHCKEMPVNIVVDKKRIIGKRRAQEEERHTGFLPPPHPSKNPQLNFGKFD
jgi:hypothetical protein